MLKERILNSYLEPVPAQVAAWGAWVALAAGYPLLFGAGEDSVPPSQM